MNLLDPNEIKSDKKENADQSQRLIRVLSEEEAKLNKEVNILRENSIAEKDAIKKDTDEFVARETLRKEELTKEVNGLEQRRAEALKPIESIRAEADTHLNEAKQALARAEEKERGADTKYEQNVDLAEKLEEKKDELAEREDKVTIREDRATVEESRLKDSANALTDKWVKLHSETNRINVDFENREKRISDREKVLDIRQAQQEEREVLQTEHRKAIRDKYATLARAIEESKKKHNINI